MEFEKTIEINAQDYYHYSFLFGKRNIIFLTIIAFFVFFMAASVFVDQVMVQFIIAAIICVLLILIEIYNLKSRVRKLFASTRILGLPKQIKLDRSGFFTNSEIGSTNLLWSDIKKVVESDHAFYFTVYQNSNIIIPKRLLTAEEAELIRAIIKKYSSGYELPVSSHKQQ